MHGHCEHGWNPRDCETCRRRTALEQADGDSMLAGFIAGINAGAPNREERRRTERQTKKQRRRDQQRRDKRGS